MAAVRDRRAACTGDVVHEVVLCARAAPVGPGPRQRSLARACGAIPREHAEPGHEEVRESERDSDRGGRARERASELVREEEGERQKKERERDGDVANERERKESVRCNP